MKRITNIKSMDYLSLLLVLTFIPLHNIYLVFLGMLLALYKINKKYINEISTNLNNVILNFEKRDQDGSIEENTVKQDIINKDMNISLVEKVEESGIIRQYRKIKRILLHK